MKTSVFSVEFRNGVIGTRSTEAEAIRLLWKEYQLAPEECQTPKDWRVTKDEVIVYRAEVAMRLQVA